MPRARALWSAEKVVMMIVSVAGDRTAPAMPGTALAVVSQTAAREPSLSFRDKLILVC